MRYEFEHHHHLFLLASLRHHGNKPKGKRCDFNVSPTSQKKRKQTKNSQKILSTRRVFIKHFISPAQNGGGKVIPANSVYCLIGEIIFYTADNQRTIQGGMQTITNSLCVQKNGSQGLELTCKGILGGHLELYLKVSFGGMSP